MIKTRKLNSLKDAPYNPRVITDKALNGLEYSIEEFGDISGIVFNRKTGNLVAAHQRKKAIERSNKDFEIILTNEFEEPTKKGTVAYGYLDFKGERFNYREVWWDEAKERAANIAANSEAIQGNWSAEAQIIIEDIALNMPEAFANLYLSDIPLGGLSLPSDLIEVERQTSEIAQTQRNVLRFGEVKLYISDEELESLELQYKVYINENNTDVGFVTNLLGDK